MLKGSGPTLNLSQKGGGFCFCNKAGVVNQSATIDEVIDDTEENIIVWLSAKPRLNSHRPETFQI